MNRLSKLGFLAGLVAFFLAAMPSVAQLPSNGIKFTTTFPFYAGEKKMPPGTYLVAQTTKMNGSTLTIASTDGSHSAIVGVRVSPSGDMHQHSDVMFNKYGNMDFLSAVWGMDHMSEYKVTETKNEEEAAAKTPAKQHSVPEQAQ